MNFQDASNLRIPEGYVRTIHDKNNRLLWGSVGYDVSFDGNATQTTYSGKNKVDGANPTDANFATASLSNNVIKISSTATSTIPYARWIIDNLSANDVVRYSGVIMDSNGQIVLQYDNNGTWTTVSDSIRQYTDGTTPATHTWTNTGNTTKVRLLLYANKTIPTGNSSSRYKNAILTVNNSDLSYEPYVGGTASPNPSYPQPISTVTGAQNIKVVGKNLLNDAIVQRTIPSSGSFNATIPMTIGAGTYSFGAFADEVFCPEANYYVFQFRNGPTPIVQSSTPPTPMTLTAEEASQVDNMFFYFNANFTGRYGGKHLTAMVCSGSTLGAYEPYQGQEYTINLGDIELAKIGDYQDRIYKEDSKWYIEKQVGKVVLDGSEAGWGMFSNNNAFYSRAYDVQPPSSMTTVGAIIANYYTADGELNIYNARVDYGIGISNQNRLLIRNKDITTVANLKTWLSTHPTTVYYALATPTTTEITNQTLIDQLEAVYDWVRRHGYNAQVSGNLPIIINRTALPTA